VEQQKAKAIVSKPIARAKTAPIATPTVAAVSTAAPVDEPKPAAATAEALAALPEHPEPKPAAAPTNPLEALFPVAGAPPFGALFRNQHMLIYGAQGCGKTTFFGGYAGAYILPFEPGCYQASRYWPHKLDSWEKFEQALKAIWQGYQTKHLQTVGITTIVIDSVDALYKLAVEKICRDNAIKDLSDMSYGRGYSLADGLFMGGIDRLKSIMPIAMTSHVSTITKPVESKSGIEKDVEKIVPSIKRSLNEWLSGWVPIVGYAYKSAEGEFLVKFHSHFRLESKCRDSILEGIKKPYPNKFEVVAKAHDDGLKAKGYRYSEEFQP
jgi:hypothetical protein